MANPFAYAELHTTGPEAALDFYRRLFDWKTTTSDTPAGPYTELHTGEGLEGGMMRAMGPASHWVVYLRVDELRAHVAKARELGAKVLVEFGDVPDVGWFSVLQDPTGATFGLFQRRQPAQS